MTESPKRWHRWFRFRLRTFLVAWLIVAVWSGSWIGTARQQRDAVRKIHELGDRVVIGYSYQMAPSNDKWPPTNLYAHRPLNSEHWPRVDPTAVSWVPRFALQRFGEDYFHNAVYVKVWAPHAGKEPELLTQLARLRNLQHLRLWFVPTNDTIESLAELRELKSLQLRPRSVSESLPDNLWRTLQRLPRLEAVTICGRFTDADLAQLARMKRLKSLFLDYWHSVQITDVGLGHLARLRHLEELYISPGSWDPSAQVTGEGIARLAACTRLRELWLGSLNVTDDDLYGFAPFTSLEGLTLERAKITGVGFGHLTGLANLKRLNLKGTLTTDEALPFLVRLPELEAIDFRGTYVTVDGLRLLVLEVSPTLRKLAVNERPSLPFRWMSDSVHLLGIGEKPGGLTAGDLARLREALPQCEIDAWRGP